MEMILREDIFDRFVTLIVKKYHKDPGQFIFIMGSRDIPPSFAHFDDFLRERKIPFRKTGVSVVQGKESLACASLDHEIGSLPFGLYSIYPESEREIVLYFYKDMDERFNGSHPRYIAGYRNRKDYEELISFYNRYYASRKREEGKIIVYGGNDIERPPVSWDELVLPERVKDDIRRNVEHFMTSETVYKKLGVPYRRGILFTGPPGNGKTMLLKVIASQYPKWQMIAFSVSANTGNGDLDELFRMATEDYPPAVLCFEDLDSLFKKDHITMSHFLNKLDGFERHDRLLVLATTNHPEDIDPALTSRPSRFDRVWIIGPPDYDCRHEYLRKCFNGNLSEPFASELAQATEGFSMAYLKELYVSASIRAIQGNRQRPEENDIEEVFDLLTSQLKGAKQQFFTLTEKKIGFGVG